IGLIRKCQHPIARLEVFHLVADGADHATHIAAKNRREGQRKILSSCTGTNCSVNRIYTRCDGCDQHRIFADPWIGNVIFKLQLLRTTILMQHHCFHRALLCSCWMKRVTDWLLECSRAPRSTRSGVRSQESEPGKPTPRSLGYARDDNLGRMVGGRWLFF